MNIYRQGDVLLLPIETKESELEPAAKDPRGLVLAEGEVRRGVVRDLAEKYSVSPSAISLVGKGKSWVEPKY